MTLWSLAAPFAWPYAGISALRNALYERGVFAEQRTPAGVISVGALMAGGSGKSPLSMEIVRILREQVIPAGSVAPGDTPVAIVSRGYGRETYGPRVVSDGRRLLLDARLGGDEPVMFARELNGVPVVVAEDRVRGVTLARRMFGARVAVLDDAFSHRRIARDLDILLLDRNAPDWWWRLLPAGRLREWPAEIARADVVVLTGHADPGREAAFRKWVDRHAAGELAVGMAEAADLHTLDGERVPLSELWRARVACVSAIARPERFVISAREWGADVVLELPLQDHAYIPAGMWASIRRRARAARAVSVVTTAKDAARGIPPGSPPVLVLGQRWRWSEGGEMVAERLARVWETAAR
ncbi:MAG: Tetraacyldisaccharide 4'-kinase [Calditrichaeota bacterium]|nr:Tetraacyldisaccharide 4'-kinase [Calditrichota bacterium]